MRIYAKQLIERKNRAFLQTKIGMIGLFVVLITLLSINGLNIKAKSVPGNTYNQIKYESVLLSKGDSLWDLAYSHTDGTKKQMQYCMKEIRRINHMSRFEVLKAGESVIVPCMQK